MRVCILLLFGLSVALPTSARAHDPQPIHFNRDIRPILSDNCYQCHGPDQYQRQAGLRLDLRPSALEPLGSGKAAIVPGDSASSSVIERVTADSDFVRMPPEDTGKALDEAQIELLKRWIDEGAEYEEHWAYQTPTRPIPPETNFESHVKSPIDRFVFAELEQAGLQPAPEADKETLIRRVTFDLTGLPPTLEEIDAFLADTSPGAYERLVDRLLVSPRFGEHRARYWLDAARYGDTHGLHLDNERQIWPYRDWVIGAFNQNMPFDQFTIEQLAGDLLPDATVQQQVATGFNRCNVTTSEGGSIDEEYRVRYAIDRVETTATVWMGMTAGCAACHDHKFDPVSQREFFQLYAYFYNFAENPMDGNAPLPDPVVEVPTDEQQQLQQEYRRQLAEIDARIQQTLAAYEYREPEESVAALPDEPVEFVWIDDAAPDGAQRSGDSPWDFVTKDEHPVYSGEKSVRRSAPGRSQHLFTDAPVPLRVGEGDRLFAHVYLDPDDPPQQIMLQFHNESWNHRAYWGENLIDWGENETASRRPIGALPEPGQWVRLEVPAADVGLDAGSEINGWAFTQYGGTVYWDKAGIVSKTPQGEQATDSLAGWDLLQRTINAPSLPEPIKSHVLTAPDERSNEQQKAIRDYFIQHVYPPARDRFGPLNQQRREMETQQQELDEAIPRTLVMADRQEKQPVYLLTRGEYDQPDESEALHPNVPQMLPPLAEDAPPNRLGLAQWLVRPDHPLTARVTMNRFWQQLFAVGIVKSTEDFGMQSDWPSHPELLDWLAVEFMESGWDVKHMFKLMVMSHAYRQSSQVTPEHLQKDPDNRLLSRAPRFRLDAEMIRDQALAVSDLIVGTIGGPSVKPYQPEGLWEAVGYSASNTVYFEQDAGDKLYRRSMYTYWKRTAPPPSLQIFDAPSREYCVVRRERTNTPAAALVLMNDVQYVEAARHLAQRMMSEAASPEERIRFAFRLATARQPEAEEMDILRETYERFLAEFTADVEAAIELISFGDSPPGEQLDVAQWAAWTMVASAILNLDETITKG